MRYTKNNKDEIVNLQGKNLLFQVPDATGLTKMAAVGALQRFISRRINQKYVSPFFMELFHFEQPSSRPFSTALPCI